jgi:hypothetical protein
MNFTVVDEQRRPRIRFIMEDGGTQRSNERIRVRLRLQACRQGRPLTRL